MSLQNITTTTAVLTAAAGNGTDLFDCIDEPTHLASDLVKLVVLAALFVLGATINLSAFEHMRLNAPSGCSSGSLQQTHTIKQHLNLSDLMVIFVYGLSEMTWVYTYSWRGSDSMCRLVQFGRAFVFYASSNLMCAIAITRILSLLAPPKTRQLMVLRTRRVLCCAWLCAALCSLPQAAVWLLVTVPICQSNARWSQCITRWDAPGLVEPWVHDDHLSPHAANTLYNAAHLAALFWIPLVVIVVCYVWLLVLLAQPDCRSLGGGAVGHDPTVGACGSLQSGISFELSAYPRTASLTGGSSVATTTPSHSDHTSILKQQPKSSQQRRHRATVALHLCLKLTGAYIVCYLPYNVLQTLKIVHGGDWYGEYAQEWDSLNALLIVNAILNPFIYGTFTTPAGAQPTILGTRYRLCMLPRITFRAAPTTHRY